MTHHPRTIRFALLVLCLLPLGQAAIVASAPTTSALTTPVFESMRIALQQALHLHFDQAFETTTRFEESAPLEARLTRGIIAYFQGRWQSRYTSTAQQTSHTLLAELLTEGQQQLASTADEPQLKLVLGLAALFDALLPQASWWSTLHLWHSGQTWLREALRTHERMVDAHLGLGLAYFVSLHYPPFVQPFLSSRMSSDSSTALHHLRRAATAGTFTRDIAQTFLLRFYMLEHMPQEAIPLGRRLQETYADNGYYALLTGQSECAAAQYTSCAMTLGALAANIMGTPTMLANVDDRFDLYYLWGRALYETQHYDLAFQAFRQALNQDPQTVKDNSLWAKYYLAMLYERRGAVKTAKQIYRKLSRGRNVDTLHHQVAQRLARLQ